MSNTILIVDDDPMELQMLEVVLQRQGYRLETAHDGLQALEKARRLVPDVVLLDVMMPGVDGFEVCRQLRRDPILGEVPIIMVTALGDRKSLLAGLEAGADDFVTKPIDTLVMRARLHSIIRLNRYRGLQQARTTFQWVVEQAEEGYLILTEKQEILYASPQARLYLGLPLLKQQPGTGPLAPPTLERRVPGPADTLPFQELVRRQYICQPQAFWDAWPAPGPEQGPGYAIRPERENEESLWLQVDLLEVPPRGEERYFVRLRDVTHSIQEHRLMWSFHDIISHKFQTPLALLAGFLETMRDDRLSPEQLRQLVEAALESTQRLQGEVGAVFRYLGASTLLQDGLRHCSLAQLLDILQGLRAGFDMVPLTIVNQRSGPLEQAILPLAPPAAEAVLRELLQNATKFHPSRSPAITFVLAGDEKEALLQFMDDGQTLLPGQLLKMWMPYYQVDKGFSGETPGMGLGLSMISAILWSAGGQCRSINREDGPGIVIELTLPLVSPATLPAEAGIPGELA